MAAVFFYRAPTDGLGLRKLKKTKKNTLQWLKAIVFEKKIFIYNLFKAGPMRHKRPFFKKIW